MLQSTARPTFVHTMAATDHIQALLERMPHEPGVYQHFDADGKLLYIGKAKNLKKARRQLLHQARSQRQNAVAREEDSGRQVDRHGHRSRCFALREQHDQGAPADLQHPA